MKEYKSVLSLYIQEYLDLKESLGYSRNTHTYYLHEIDNDLIQKHPELTTLTEGFTIEWIKKRQSECINTQKRRMVTIRELGKYLNANGINSFILPSDFIGKYSRSTPYLFTDEELTKLFFAIDHIQSYFESPKREYVLPVLFRMMYCCGLRPGEALDLQSGDVDLSSGTLFIRNSKGHRDSNSHY
jgi:integrase/recombinase XerD